MYQSFFGFKERPFSLVPNPAYLFLSKSHEEALAHLSYAVSQGEGFMEITGEVGTGKTTLCRSFLENLNDRSEAAYIFNPKMDSVQLLKTINDELGIPSDADTIKDLIDELNRFLIAEKKAEKTVVLIIDEAQNLEYEVLEQLRLLSNLETTRNKLLQIILVGQPELNDMLQSKKLRQLKQRITLSYILSPLSFKETHDYIHHRLNVASRKPGIKFPRAVVQTIYKYSNGIPRLINIASDRVLLTAYGLNRQRITARIARIAIDELTGNSGEERLFKIGRGWIPLAALCAILLLTIFHPPDLFRLHMLLTAPKEPPAIQFNPIIDAPRPKEPAPVQPKEDSNKESTPVEPQQNTLREPLQTELAESNDQAPVMVNEKTVTENPKKDKDAEPAPAHEATMSESPDSNIVSLEEWLMHADPRATRSGALRTILKVWKIELQTNGNLGKIEDDESFLIVASKHNGFSTKKVSQNMNLIRILNLPAILELKNPNGSSAAYITLTHLNGASATLITGNNKEIIADRNELESYWSGVAYIPWRNFLACEGEIPDFASDDSIITLKIILRDIGFKEIKLNAVYDEETRAAVKKVQIKHGLLPDGVVGTNTKIILYNEYRQFEIPHIHVN